MRTIKLQSLSLVNFKGVRSLDVQFSEQVTVISGENGTGKTTVFDAFLWLLFGKDSTGRSDSNFGIKTLDPETGKPILRLEHSVTAVLDVDGKLVKLQRCYVENWVKPRGTTEEVLQNHKTEFYVNDVKVGTKKEYDAEINAIIPEDLFRMITNPFYFTSLKADVQKSMLLDMAGAVTDDEVAQLNPDYIELLAQLSGRTLHQYAREVAAKKRACKDELSVIPSQIETAQKLRPESQDWKTLEDELSVKKQKLAEIDEQLTDRRTINEQEYIRQARLSQDISNCKIALSKREHEIKTEANKEVYEADVKINKLDYAVRGCQDEIRRADNNQKRLYGEIVRAESELDELRKQYRAINAEQIQYPAGAFVCPTCKRPLDTADVEAKQQELQDNFNQVKAARLKENKEKGLAKVSAKSELEKQYEAAKQKMIDLETQLSSYQTQLEHAKANRPEAPSIKTMVDSDIEIVRLTNELHELENQQAVERKPVETDDLIQAKETLNDNIQELYARLALRQQIERADNEIKSLEEKRVKNMQKLAELEKWEFVALSFQKDKDATLLERVNGLFSYVSFSFIDEQLNGGEKLTCVCTVNGTPYPDVNAAGKVNAGLDIINAICKSQGVCAPIFIDNRESVNEIIPTSSQVINLVVSRDKSLTIK